MLNRQVEAMESILKNKDLRDYSGDFFWDFIGMIVCSDSVAGAKSLVDVKNLVFNIPTLLFWDKMKRFLFGTFHDYSEQVKLASKFNDSNKKYKEFTKKLIHLIDEIDDDTKVDFYSSLTRCFLLTDLNEQLYFKLSKFLLVCTVDELLFVREFPLESVVKCNTMVSVLYNYSLFEQFSNANETWYGLSDFGKALKLDCLNFSDNPDGSKNKQNKPVILSYKDVKPIGILEPVSMDDITRVWDEKKVDIHSVFN